VIAITEQLARRLYVCSIGQGEAPMLTTTFRQTREIIGERPARSQGELATLGELDRHDLSSPGNFAKNKGDGDDHHHRMFANLVAAAWVGTLMTSAYYVFNHLLVVS
jgi:hypothetical protein